MCLYLAAHICRHVLATYLFRTGSRNAFDEFRNSNAAPWNMGLLCGQTAQDPRLGHPTVTCSDNAKRPQPCGSEPGQADPLAHFGSF